MKQKEKNIDVLITTTTFAEYDKTPLEILAENGINYTLNPLKRKLKENEIMSLLQENAVNGLVAGTEPLTGQVLAKSKSLRVISRVGKGLDNIDLEAAKELDIKVFNTSSGLAFSVSELTLGLILCCLRKINVMDRNMRKNIWKKEMGSLLRGKTLGIIGFGDIGSKTASLSSAFGANVIYYDINKIESDKFKAVSLKELLRESDIISLHSSSGEKLIDKEEIEEMKNGVVVINTSRGSIIDENTLYEALLSKKIAVAGLDVFEKEPYNGKLSELDNVVLTSHAGSYAKEARIQMEIKAVENLIEGLKEIKLL